MSSLTSATATTMTTSDSQSSLSSSSSGTSTRNVDNMVEVPLSESESDSMPPTFQVESISSTTTMTSYLMKRIFGPVWIPLSIGTIALLISNVSNQGLLQCVSQLLVVTGTGSTENNTIIGSGRSNQSIAANTNIGLNVLYNSPIVLVVISGTVASFVRTMSLSYAQECIKSTLRYDLFRSFLLLQNQRPNHRQRQRIQQEESETDIIAKQERYNSTSPKTPLLKKKEDEDEDVSLSIPISPAIGIKLLNETTVDVSQMITSSIPNLLRGLISVSFSSYKMIVMDSYLFGISLSTVPLIGAMAILLHKQKKRLVQQQQNTIDTNLEFVTEKLHHIDLVRLSHRQYDEISSYKQQLNEIHSNIGTKLAIQSASIMGFLFLSSATTLFVVLYQGQRNHHHHHSSSNRDGTTTTTTTRQPTNLPSFATYTFLLGLGTSSITKSLSEISIGMKSFKRLYSTIQLLSKQKETDNNLRPTTQDAAISSPLVVNNDQVASIIMKNVSFAYNVNDGGTGAATMVLNDVTISFSRGQVIAIVGKNGSGKSTCTKLLTGLYQPTTGSVLVQMSDSITTYPITDVIDSTYRQQQCQQHKQLVQIIPQNIGLFNTSIYDNVRYCQPTATRQDVIDALDRANCTSFINTLPNGIDTIIGLNGNMLSGGQRQRIALARALVLCQPALLIMDEPNNNLDNDGYQAIIEAIQYCRTSNIALCIISHDVHTLQHTDTIVVLNDGSITEQGTFKDLTTNKSSALCQLMPNVLLL